MWINTQDNNILPHSENGGLDSLSISIPEQVNVLLWSIETIYNDFYKQNIIVSDTYGVCVQLHLDEVGFDLQGFQKQLRICIDTIYKNWVYFDQLDIKKLECVLYGTQEEVRADFDPVYGGIRLCSNVRKISELDSKILSTIYAGKLQIKDDGMEIIFMPGSLLQIERMLGENYAKHDLFVLRSDLFHAYFWSYEIKYYGKSLFLKNIEGKRRDELDAIVAPLKWIIATWKKPTKTQHDEKYNYDTFEENKSKNPTVQINNPFPPLRIKRRPVIINGKTAEWWEMECFFPKAKSGQVILEIIAGKVGNSGINTKGQIIPYEEINKIDTKSVINPDSTEFIQIDTETDSQKTRIIAKENIYISLDKQWKLIASRHKKYIGNIWAKTGSLSLPQDGTTFLLQWDIESWYHIRGYDIMYSGELHGKIFAQNQVTVKSGGIIWWTIISDNGNINIEQWTRVQDGTHLTATNGIITIDWDLNHATIIAHHIKIQGRATKCVLIGWTIEIWQNKGSKIFAESFDIKSDIDGDSEYEILVYAGIHSLISTFTEKLGDAEWKWELEKLRVSELWKKIDKDEILTRGIIHPDSIIKIVPIPFLINTELWEFLGANNDPQLLRSKREDWLQKLAWVIHTTDGINCSRQNIPLVRSSAISILESSLSNRSAHWEIPRDPRISLFARWIRLVASVGQLSGHIFDYSDSGASFILINKNPNGASSIIKDTTIDVTILGNLSIPFFVTRSENKLLKWVNYTFVAGAYLEKWTAVEISKTVARIDTQWK